MGRVGRAGGRECVRAGGRNGAKSFQLPVGCIARYQRQTEIVRIIQAPAELFKDQAMDVRSCPIDCIREVVVVGGGGVGGEEGGGGDEGDGGRKRKESS